MNTDHTGISIKIYHNDSRVFEKHILKIYERIENASLKIITFFMYNNAVRLVICEGWNFTQKWKHLHDRIISVRGEFWDHKTRLTPSHFIEVHSPNEDSERPCIFVLGVAILSLSAILIFYFLIVRTVWHTDVFFIWLSNNKIVHIWFQTLQRHIGLFNGVNSIVMSMSKTWRAFSNSETGGLFKCPERTSASRKEFQLLKHIQKKMYIYIYIYI